ncbi:MAG: DUF6273 domain-containing protein [Oscillospiraceae bacterium]
MSERFEKLYSLSKNLYIKDFPIIVSAGSLLRDKETGSLIVQLKFHSVSEEIIKAVKVSLSAYDILNKEIEGIEDYQYLDLNIENGQEFGSNKAIIMPSEVTRSFSINRITVVTTGGIAETTSLGLLPYGENLNSALINGELVKQYKIATNEKAEFVPKEFENLWLCSCGEWNSSQKCSSCRASKINIFDSYDIDALDDAANERLKIEKEHEEELKRQEEIERQKREEQLKIAKERRRRKEKLYKKIALITIIVTSILIIVLTLFFMIIQPSFKYNNAIRLIKSGNIIEAYELLTEIESYKDSRKIVNSIYDEYIVEKLKSAKIGDYIFFGEYEQDNNFSNGKEKIEWIVLDKKDEKIFVFSKYALDWMRYNTEYYAVTWETCLLRKWLNNGFINSAFSPYEKSMISTVEVSADENPSYDTPAGNSTYDKVFLLSIDEVNKYFSSDMERRCEATDYVIKQGVNVGSSDEGFLWWLRSPGQNEIYVATVTSDYGHIIDSGHYVGEKYITVRPAMWIDFSQKNSQEDFSSEIYEDLEDNSSESSQDVESTVNKTGGKSSSYINAEIGDIIYFGSCEQDNDLRNGSEAISWFILCKTDDSIMVVSEKILYYLPYNDGKSQRITWEECSLRTWLNSEFLNIAFSDEEKNQINQVIINNDDNPVYGTEGGNNTEDKIFLLSCEEAEQYTKLRNYSLIEETPYSRADGLERYGYINDNYVFLRSPGSENYTASLILNGEVQYFGEVAGSWELCGICPAMWIDISE